MIVGDVEVVGTQVRYSNLRTSILFEDNLTLKKLGDVDDNTKTNDRHKVGEKTTPMRSSIHEDSIIMQRIVDSDIAFKGDTDCRKCGTAHGDEADWVEEVGE